MLSVEDDTDDDEHIEKLEIMIHFLKSRLIAVSNKSNHSIKLAAAYMRK